MLQREIRALTLKTKTFATAEPNVKSLEYRVKKIREDGTDFQDSIFSCNESRENTPDQAFTKISKLVESFLEKIHLNESKEASKISRYLSNIAVNYTSGQAQELLPQVILNLKKILPDTVEISQNEIGEFFETIVSHFQTVSDVNYGDIIKAIVANAVELNESTSQHDPQNILIEIIQQLVNTLKAEELLSNDCLADVVKAVKTVPGLGMDTGLLDVNEIVEMLDIDDVDISMNSLRSAVAFLVSQLVEDTA